MSISGSCVFICVCVFLHLVQSAVVRQADGDSTKDVTHVEEEGKRSVAAGVAVAGAVLNGISSFISGINGPNNVKDVSNNVKDTIIANRAMRIVAVGNCATVTDRDTGFKSSYCADSGAQATALATDELLTLLIKLKQLSLDDLHLRPPDVTRPPTLCKDTVSLIKCARHMILGHCHIGSPYFHWMHENCYRSCAKCNSLDVIFPKKANGR